MGSRWEQGSPGRTAGWRPVRRTEPLDSQLLEVGSRLCFSSRKTAASLSPRCLEQRGNPSRERGGHVKPRSLCRSNSSASLQTSCWRAVLGHGSYRSHLQKGLLRPLRAGRGKGPLWTPNANEPVAKMACVVLLLVSPSQPACGAWTIPYTRGGGGDQTPGVLLTPVNRGSPSAKPGCRTKPLSAAKPSKLAWRMTSLQPSPR